MIVEYIYICVYTWSYLYPHSIIQYRSRTTATEKRNCHVHRCTVPVIYTHREYTCAICRVSSLTGNQESVSQSVSGHSIPPSSFQPKLEIPQDQV